MTRPTFGPMNDSTHVCDLSTTCSVFSMNWGFIEAACWDFRHIGDSNSGGPQTTTFMSIKKADCRIIGPPYKLSAIAPMLLMVKWSVGPGRWITTSLILSPTPFRNCSCYIQWSFPPGERTGFLYYDPLLLQALTLNCPWCAICNWWKCVCTFAALSCGVT